MGQPRPTADHERQGRLFEATQLPHALARRTDPWTSHAAAAEVEGRSIAAGQRRLCLEEVRRHPGATAAEVAVATGLERHAPSRRLPELRAEGLVSNGPARVCSVQGRASITWWPVSPHAPRVHGSGSGI